MTLEQVCQECEHEQDEHGQERALYDTDSRREVCLQCPGWEDPGYPRGKAWHRFRAPQSVPVDEGVEA